MPASALRNVALVGHYGAGKTTLAEALLFKSGAIKRQGTVAEKNTVSDFDPDEKEHKHSIEVAVLHADHKGKHINLLDCPGISDFVSGMVEGLAAADSALLCVNASAGVEVMTRKLWGMLEFQGLPRTIVLTKLDHERAKFEEVIAQLKDAFGAAVTPAMLPLGMGKDCKGFFPLWGDLSAAPAEIASAAKDLSAKLIETIVAADEKLMERYLADEKIPVAELNACFTRAMQAGAIVPVLYTAADKALGASELLDFIADILPAPNARKVKLTRPGKALPEEREIEAKPDGPLYAQVFKSKRDPFTGKVAYLRIFSGSLAPGVAFKVTGQTKPDKVSHFSNVQGHATTEIHSAGPGDIVAIFKNEHLHCGDTATSEDLGWSLPKLPFPVGMSALAVQAKNRNDEAKVSEQLRHLSENDPTFKVEVDHETHELVIHGMGQIHLDLNLHRLKRLHLEVTTKPPKIPYRSTVSSVGVGHYRHKKQSGGAGQFGEVNIQIEPNPGKGFEFVDEIVGGVIPKNFIPSVEKGIQKKLVEGVWPGIMVQDVRVRLNDGKSHDVDSKDIAFQIAGREAFKLAFEKAHPVLIEPIVHLEIVIPGKYMGDITGNLSGHRGRISGMDQMGDLQVVKAEVPLSAMQNYSAELKAMTAGEGFFSMELSHYAPVPTHVAGPVIAAAKSRQVHEADE